MKPDQPTIVHVHNTNYASATAAAGPPPPRKSIVVAYLALALGWLAGVHRFYLRKSPVRWTAFMWISAATVGIISPPGSSALLIPFFGLPLIDAFLIPGWVRRHNAGRETALAQVATTPLSDALAASAQPSPGTAPQERPERPQDLRTRLLRAAHRGDGRLTLTQAVMETEADFDKVEKALHALVAAGHIDVDNDPDSGVVLYLFPELVGRPQLRDPAAHG